MNDSSKTASRSLWMGCVIVGALVVLSMSVSAHAGEILERPIAVIGDRIILQSELMAQMSLYSAQLGIDPRDQAAQKKLRDELLEQMINDQLILIEAEKDTLIKVESEEVEQALDEHMRQLKAQFPSEAEYARQLAMENLTESELRRRYRSEVTSQLLKQKLIQRQLASVSVSTSEVKEFFRHNTDSLPKQPRAVKLAHILLTIRPSDQVIDSIRTRLREVLSEISAGMTFGEAARTYSQDATAGGGGDLGWFGRGEMLPAIENAAFQLPAGGVSGIVQSAVGFHVIECVEKSGDRVHACHIMFPLVATAADTARVAGLADSLRSAFVAGADFCNLAREFSNDEESQKNCGELGWYPIGEMFPAFKNVLEDAQVGEIPPVTLSDFGYHVLRVLDRRESRELALEEDWDTIKKLARQDKTQDKVNDWLNQIRDKTYVSVKEL